MLRESRVQSLEPLAAVRTRQETYLKMMTEAGWQPQDLVQHLLFALLGDRSKARISVSEQGKTLIVHVCLDQNGMTKLGGENGRTVKALHTLLETLGQRHGTPTSLKIDLLTAEEENSSKQSSDKDTVRGSEPNPRELSESQ